MWQSQTDNGQGRGASAVRKEPSYRLPSSVLTKWQRRTVPSPSTDTTVEPVRQAYAALVNWLLVTPLPTPVGQGG